MSSIYITSRLHSAWHERARLWASEMRAIGADRDGLTRFADPTSSVQPPPEEFGDVLRVILPFINHGLNHVTASAIIASHTASIGVSTESFLPLAYFSGLPSIVANGRTTVLSFDRGWIGAPFVPIENFPFARLFGNGDLPASIISFPPESFGKVVFSGYHGHNLWPCRFNTASSLSQRELDTQVHPRELERAQTSPGLIMRDVFTSLRYTGCIRPPTPSELDEVFANVIRPDTWMKGVDTSFRDFFCGMGMSESILDTALNETTRLTASDAVTPQSSSATDVPAPTLVERESRRSRRPTTTGQQVDGNLDVVAEAFSARPAMRPLRSNPARATVYSSMVVPPSSESMIFRPSAQATADEYARGLPPPSPPSLPSDLQ